MSDPVFHGRLRDAIKALFDGVHDAVTSTPPAPTVDQLLALYRPHADRPRPGRLELGEAALDRLLGMARADAPEDERAAIWGAVTPGGGGLFGVPLVLPTGDEALAPDAWRLLDTDGHVIKEGTL